MDFELSEEHRLIRETVRRVAREVVAPRAAEIGETDEYPQDIFEAFRDLGLLGLTMPEQYGGSGAGVLGAAIAIEEVAKYCCASGLIIMLSTLGTRPILVGGTEEQKQRWVTPVARGELRASFSLSEPSVGSDAAGLQAYAVRDGDSYVLNGEKNYVSGGTQADYCVVFAKTDRAAGGRGISAFIVPTDTPGYSIARVNPKMGVKGMQIANFVLEDVRVPAANLVGGVEGKGLNHALLALNCVRPLVGARGLGLAEGAMSYALEFARNRKAFGQSVADFQAIQFMFADMAIQIESARLLVYQAAHMVDQGRYERKDAAYLSIAKTVATEAANKIASDCIQVLGAQGYLKDHPLERHFRDARQLMIVEGTSQVQRVVIARALLEGDIDYS
jgi:alkylation response protein AidB-like acyl-CoA dehydrogenase